ncbi:MAG TPA: glycosyltransferase [Thermoleophilaceae bacterium]
MSRPDVALITPYPPLGQRHAGHSGVTSYAGNLAHALAAEGASVTVVAPDEPGEPPVAQDGPVRVERRFRRGAGALPVAGRAAKQTKAPVVHLQHELFLYGGPSSIPGLMAALAGRRRDGTAQVVTMHQVVESSTIDRSFTQLHRVQAPAVLARAGLATVQQAIRRLSSRVIVHEPSFAEMVGNAVVVPHGVETAAPVDREHARAELGLDHRLTVLCFGFLAPYKGLETALEAAELAGDRVRLVIAGGEHPRLAASGDSYADELRDRYGATATFTGRVPEEQVATWFSAADIALFPYPRPFSSSGSLALALAHRTPFLVSPQLGQTIGAPESITVPLDPPVLANRLKELAGAPARLEGLRESCAGFGSGRSWSDVARRHLELYEEVR